MEGRPECFNSASGGTGTYRFVPSDEASHQDKGYSAKKDYSCRPSLNIKASVTSKR